MKSSKSKTAAKIVSVVALAASLALGCAAKKKPEHFGTSVNFPRFQGAGDFMRSLGRVSGIMAFKRLDGKKVDLESLDPAFREKLCLVVTINNHCGGG